jgi:hypothetical protein
VAQNKKADGVNVTSNTVLASINPKLLLEPYRYGKIDAKSVDDCADNDVMEYLEYMQERNASVTAQFVKAVLLAKVSSIMAEKGPVLYITKEVGDYYSLHRYLGPDFVNCKPKKPVEYLVSVIKPATFKDLIESELGMLKLELKEDFLEFVAYLEKMAIIHDEHCHVIVHKKTGNSGTKNTSKGSGAGGRSSWHDPGGSSPGGGIKTSDRDQPKSGNERSSDSSGTGKQSKREPPSCVNTKQCAHEKNYLVDCPQTSEDEDIAILIEYMKKRDAEMKKAKVKTTERRRTTEMARPRTSLR